MKQTAVIVFHVTDKYSKHSLLQSKAYKKENFHRYSSSVVTICYVMSYLLNYL